MPNLSFMIFNAFDQSLGLFFFGYIQEKSEFLELSAERRSIY